MKRWLVPFEATVRGVVVVDAVTPEAAVLIVEGGDFDIPHAAEMVDWAAIGKATEDE